jgi:hypothetical protein
MPGSFAWTVIKFRTQNDVEADSLYEAVAIAVSQFRDDSLDLALGPMTDFIGLVPQPY